MPEWTSNLGGKIKSLADGQLATSKGTLHTGATGKTTVITKLTLVNTGSSPVNVNLYFKASGGTSRRIIPKDMEMQGNGYAMIEEGQTLEAGDLIEGDATSATTVDYTLSGVEIT